MLAAGTLTAIKLPPKLSFAALQHLGFNPATSSGRPWVRPLAHAEGELTSRSSETLRHSRPPGAHGERRGHTDVSHPRWLCSPRPVARGWQVGGSGGLVGPVVCAEQTQEWPRPTSDR